MPVFAVKWIQPTLAWIISSLRAPKSMEGYRSIGGGSPLRRITNEQAEAIAAQLEARGQPANVYVAMRYWKPFTEDAMEQVPFPHTSTPTVVDMPLQNCHCKEDAVACAPPPPPPARRGAQQIWGLLPPCKTTLPLSSPHGIVSHRNCNAYLPNLLPCSPDKYTLSVKLHQSRCSPLAVS